MQSWGVFRTGHGRCMSGGMEKDERTIMEARGFAELGMYQEAWEAVERLPQTSWTSPQVLAVRLLVCSGLKKWDMGLEFARLVGPVYPREVREAAGRCHLARAEALCAGGDVDGAKEAVKVLMSVWPEGRQAVVKSKAWECL